MLLVDTSASPRTDEVLVLPDGRRLAYAEYGDPLGAPVMLFHGAPGSRLGWGLFPGCPFREGVRLIAPDRPGYGVSDPHRNATYADWPDDVSALADALQLDRFAVVGVSSGGPFALACGWKIPHRLTGLAVVSSVSPLAPEARGDVARGIGMLYTMGRRAPWLLRLNMQLSGLMFRRNPERYIAKTEYQLAGADREAYARENVRLAVTGIMRNGFTSDNLAVADDLIRQSRPWPFELSEVKTRVRLWQGLDDRIIPPSMGRYMQKHLPDCDAEFIRDAGHLWHIEHMGDVLDSLVGRTLKGETS